MYSMLLRQSPVLALALFCTPVVAQSFGPQQVISTAADGAHSVYAMDLDGDGKADVLSVGHEDDTIAWYKNVGMGNGVGGGLFGPQQVITTSAAGAHSVYATDLDDDNDADVLSASHYDDKIAWYENVGSGNGVNGGSFGPQQVITTAADGAQSVYATNLDGDDDADVLSASNDDKIAWYENVGSGNGVNGGSFGPQQVITTDADGATSVYATDLDDDDDADVLSASWNDDKIAWYENVGAGNGVNGGSFGPQQVITTDAETATSVYATDLDGDGDADVLSASHFDDKIAWYENVGSGNGANGGSFGPQQVIWGSAVGARSVYATDLDGDSRPDVLSASYSDDTIAWYKNLIWPFPPSLGTPGTGPTGPCHHPGTAYCFGDGSGTPCPCGNASSGGTGCANSTGDGAELWACGSARVSVNNLRFTASNLVPGGPALLFVGQNATNGGNGSVFRDGLVCTDQSTVTIGWDYPNSSGGLTWFTDLSGPSIWAPGAGDTLYFQSWYRDLNGSPCGTSQNLTNGVEITFRP